MAKKNKIPDKGEGAFIPGGILIGLGLGFLYGNIPAGLFIGVGAGFVVYAIVRMLRKQ